MTNMSVDILKRMEDYDREHCWQYDMRLGNLKEDLQACNISPEEMENIQVSDFQFKLIEDKAERQELTAFIKRHEWLGTLSQFTTHWFGAYYTPKTLPQGELFPKPILAGVILMNMPNAFSKILGQLTPKLERLVSRGACISWSPKNLASTFLMWCIRYMVNNTQYRLFTAYSDPTAKELGTIYQACNWIYLGQKAGTTKRYINPYNGKLVTDRVFRARSFYKRYAKELDIEWQKHWNEDHKIHWDRMPEGVEKKLRDFSKQKQKQSIYHEFPSKHKYLYILGRDKRETKKLKKEFIARNPKLQNLPYPKERGE
tara:strand:- start:523 stop:1464 length:942 start_codon:yes stop_codon:yes gene_type:complete